MIYYIHLIYLKLKKSIFLQALQSPTEIVKIESVLFLKYKSVLAYIPSAVVAFKFFSFTLLSNRDVTRPIHPLG